ncbi:MAG: FkbM family methyltransferase [Deltaproteobacteria bacterium]|nr:FkbM family methyltransferase [Deltaproteobacteria bacterium]
MNLILRAVLEALPQAFRNQIYRYAKGYIQYHDGINNPDISTNGEFRFLRATVGDCKVVFDVGANVGEWARLVLELNPKVRLHCFEPSRATFDKLLSQRFPANVLCNDFGLSSTKRQEKLFVFSEGSGMNSLYRRQGLEDRGITPQDREEVITLRTLDDYCSEQDIQRIDYLKLDVEGHELEILRGGQRLLSDGRIGLIQFEYGGCNIDSRVFLKDLFDFTKDFRYEFYKILPQELQRVAAYSQQFENFQYSNWLLIHKNRELSC